MCSIVSSIQRQLSSRTPHYHRLDSTSMKPVSAEPRTTIVDVAAVASVGVGTASDALNGRGRMSDATRNRVIEAADMLGYRPRASARALRKGTTMALGLRFG